jgi:hypothetical protein
MCAVPGKASPPSGHTGAFTTIQGMQSRLGKFSRPLPDEKTVQRFAIRPEVLTSRKRLGTVGGYAPFGALNANARPVRALAPESGASLPMRESVNHPKARDGEQQNWCPGTDSNRHALAGGRFSYHFDFRRRPRPFVVWSTPSPWPKGFRCPPSALYTFPDVSAWAWLGVSTEIRAFTEFDGLHLPGFPRRAQFWSESAVSTDSTTRAPGADGRIFALTGPACTALSA